MDYEGGGDLGDFGPTFVGGGQEDVEERVEVVPHVIVGLIVYKWLLKLFNSILYGSRCYVWGWGTLRSRVRHYEGQGTYKWDRNLESRGSAPIRRRSGKERSGVLVTTWKVNQ